jgi:hypothetical protein
MRPPAIWRRTPRQIRIQVLHGFELPARGIHVYLMLSDGLLVLILEHPTPAGWTVELRDLQPKYRDHRATPKSSTCHGRDLLPRATMWLPAILCRDQPAGRCRD